MADYYDEYIEHLYEVNGGSFPVWSVSHAGHVQPPTDHRPIPSGGRSFIHNSYGYNSCMNFLDFVIWLIYKISRRISDNLRYKVAERTH